MAELLINTKKIGENVAGISKILEGKGIEWSLIIKLLAGNRHVLKDILSLPCVKNLQSVGDSRIQGLRTVKKINPDITTMYIKPPSMRIIKPVVKYADISLNSSSLTIKALNDEAKRQGKVHKVILMIEMGELREGILPEKLIPVYRQIFKHRNIELVGIGTNLGCMYGVEPTMDKFIQLSLFKNLLEKQFSKKIRYVSGGSSITLPLVSENRIPPSINHFRIGETVFIGKSPLNNKRFRNLNTNAFLFAANIIETELKEQVPKGKIGEGNVGHAKSLRKELAKERHKKAILDFGMLDVDTRDISTIDKSVKFVGTTSDMSVYDIGSDNRTRKTKNYKVGDRAFFQPNYMGVARLMNAKYITKTCIPR